jgi:hypothetical protein
MDRQLQSIIVTDWLKYENNLENTPSANHVWCNVGWAVSWSAGLGSITLQSTVMHYITITL